MTPVLERSAGSAQLDQTTKSTFYGKGFPRGSDVGTSFVYQGSQPFGYPTAHVRFYVDMTNLVDSIANESIRLACAQDLSWQAKTPLLAFRMAPGTVGTEFEMNEPFSSYRDYANLVETQPSSGWSALATECVPLLLALLKDQHIGEATEIAIPQAESGESPEEHSYNAALEWLQEEVGLTQASIARLVGVHRVSANTWLNQKVRPQPDHRQRILAVVEVPKLVAQLHGGVRAIEDWMDTPRGPNAEVPRSLLEQNQLGRVRALALTTSGPRDTPVASWIRDAQPSSRTVLRRTRREHLQSME